MLNALRVFLAITFTLFGLAILGGCVAFVIAVANTDTPTRDRTPTTQVSTSDGIDTPSRCVDIIATRDRLDVLADTTHDIGDIARAALANDDVINAGCWVRP